MINRKLDLKQKTRMFGDIPVPARVTWLIVHAYCKIEKGSPLSGRSHSWLGL